MRLELINTGTELLLGSTINTHLSWIGENLFPLGLRIERQLAIPDGDIIRQALLETVGRADIVLVTGTLEVGEERQAGFVTSLYRLVGARVQLLDAAESPTL